MKIFPDFTWEWIIESCERLCNELQTLSADPEWHHLSESFEAYYQVERGTVAIVHELRKHPELEKLVPMRSMRTLRWFPSEGREIQLYCLENKVKYRIDVCKNGVVEEEKIVAFDEAVDEVYAYISRLSTD
jgi:hypothetical protein